MFLKSFLLFIVIISVLIEKSISTTESGMTDVDEEKEAALKSSFVAVYRNGSFACIGYIYSVDPQRVFALRTCIDHLLSLVEKDYRYFTVIPTSNANGVKYIDATANLIVIFLENKLESELEVGFNSREVQDNDEEVEITGCTMIKWMESEKKFTIYHPKDKLVCIARSDKIEAKLQYMKSDPNLKTDYSAILLENNNILAFCYSITDNNDGTSTFECMSYENDRGDLINIVPKTSTMKSLVSFFKNKVEQAGSFFKKCN